MTFQELQPKYGEALSRVKELERESLHAAIIDKSLIWYGSVNILSYHTDDDNLIRFRNAEIATSLLATLR